MVENQEGSKVGRLRNSVSEHIRNVVQQKTVKRNSTWMAAAVQMALCLDAALSLSAEKVS